MPDKPKRSKLGEGGRVGPSDHLDVFQRVAWWDEKLGTSRRWKRERAKEMLDEYGAKPTGKTPTGEGAGTYAIDFTPDQRSEVMDELIRERLSRLNVDEK